MRTLFRSGGDIAVQRGAPTSASPALSFLIVEGNTPDLVDGLRSSGVATAADCYAAAVRAFAPDARIDVVAPDAPDVDLSAVDLAGYDGAALTGSGVAWSADDARAAPHRRLFERLAASGTPTIGSCWGMQIAAVVLGGAVRWSPNGLELGVARRIRLTEAGVRHPVFAGKTAVFDSVCIHRDEVARLPSGATLLASNDHSEIQAFAYETGGARFVGWQYHPELSLGDVAAALRNPSRATPDASTQTMIRDFEAIEAAPTQETARREAYGASDDVLSAPERRREIGAWVAALRVGAAAPAA